MIFGDFAGERCRYVIMLILLSSALCLGYDDFCLLLVSCIGWQAESDILKVMALENVGAFCELSYYTYLSSLKWPGRVLKCFGQALTDLAFFFSRLRVFSTTGALISFSDSCRPLGPFLNKL